MATLMTAHEVATIFRVAPTTVYKWADEGKIESIQLPSGVRRFHSDVVESILGFDPADLAS